MLRGLEALVPFTSAANAIACISVGRQAARDRGSLREGEEGFEQGRDHEADFLLSIGPVQLDKISRLERGNPFGNLRPFRTDRGPVGGRKTRIASFLPTTCCWHLRFGSFELNEPRHVLPP